MLLHFCCAHPHTPSWTQHCLLYHLIKLLIFFSYINESEFLLWLVMPSSYCILPLHTALKNYIWLVPLDDDPPFFYNSEFQQPKEEWWNITIKWNFIQHSGFLDVRKLKFKVSIRGKVLILIYMKGSNIHYKQASYSTKYYFKL